MSRSLNTSEIELATWMGRARFGLKGDLRRQDLEAMVVAPAPSHLPPGDFALLLDEEGRGVVASRMLSKLALRKSESLQELRRRLRGATQLEAPDSLVIPLQDASSSLLLTEFLGPYTCDSYRPLGERGAREVFEEALDGLLGVDVVWMDAAPRNLVLDRCPTPLLVSPVDWDHGIRGRSLFDEESWSLFRAIDLGEECRVFGAYLPYWPRGGASLGELLSRRPKGELPTTRMSSPRCLELAALVECGPSVDVSAYARVVRILAAGAERNGERWSCLYSWDRMSEDRPAMVRRRVLACMQLFALEDEGDWAEADRYRREFAGATSQTLLAAEAALGDVISRPRAIRYCREALACGVRTAEHYRVGIVV